MSGRDQGWALLFRIACSLIDQVNARLPVLSSWSFGGGTAMMIEINHRESQDIDIFLPDPQLLGLLNPASHDFNFELVPTDYGGDGTGFMKLAFEDVGEIDFIIAPALTPVPNTPRIIEGRTVLLETVPEIITKKIHYRGASIKPRDIFDIAAAGHTQPDAVIAALKPYGDDVAKTLAAIERLNPAFANAAIEDLAIKDHFRPIARTALPRAKDLLASV